LKEFAGWQLRLKQPMADVEYGTIVRNVRKRLRIFLHL
jgi:hypothetical protein